MLHRYIDSDLRNFWVLKQLQRTHWFLLTKASLKIHVVVSLWHLSEYWIQNKIQNNSREQLLKAELNSL